MKEEILNIAEKLRLELITDDQAQDLLLCLFGVSKCSTNLTKCENCGEMIEMVSSGESCPCCFC